MMEHGLSLEATRLQTDPIGGWAIPLGGCAEEGIRRTLRWETLRKTVHLSGSGDRTIRVWGEGALSVRGGGDTAVCAATLVGHTDWVYALVVLRDGAVASGSGDGSVRFWN